MWYAIGNWFVKITGCLAYWLFSRPKTYYENKKVQSARIKGKAIIACNHQKIFDIGVMLFTFWPRTFRGLIADIMYKKNFVLTAFLKWIGGIKVKRESYNPDYIEKSCKVLEKGGVIQICPEARLPKDENEPTPLPFKTGAVSIALKSGAPIIPVYTNSEFFNPKKPTRTIIGTPFYAADFYDDTLSEKENIRKITDHLRNRIIELKHELEKQVANERRAKNGNHGNDGNDGSSAAPEGKTEEEKAE